MSMCPYKWFLSFAAILSVLYVMVEAWMHIRDADKKLADDDYQKQYVDVSDEEDSEVEDDESTTLSRTHWLANR